MLTVDTRAQQQGSEGSGPGEEEKKNMEEEKMEEEEEDLGLRIRRAVERQKLVSTGGLSGRGRRFHCEFYFRVR